MGVFVPESLKLSVLGTLQGDAPAFASAWAGLPILLVGFFAWAAACRLVARERSILAVTANVIALATILLALTTLLFSMSIQLLPCAIILWLSVYVILLSRGVTT